MIIFLLDSDTTNGTNSSTANAIDNSLFKVNIIYNNSNTYKVNSTTLLTNARGRRARQGLVVELHKLQYYLPLSLLLVITCILHVMNRMVQSFCKTYLEIRGVSSRNCMKLLRTY